MKSKERKVNKAVRYLAKRGLLVSFLQAQLKARFKRMKAGSKHLSDASYLETLNELDR